MEVARSLFLRKKAIIDLLFLILKTTTFPRVFNFLLLKISYFFSLISGKVSHLGVPMSIGVEPTTACNLRCPQCISGLKQFTRPTGNMKVKTFEKIIQNIPSKTWIMLFFFQGEPYINPNFLDYVKKAKEKKLFTVASTNAHFINKEVAIKTIKSGLDYLIISMDGITQDVYQKYRVNGSLEKVLNSIKNIVSAKQKLKSKNPIIEIQFIVFKHNEHQIKDFIKISRELGADVVKIKSAQIYYDYEEWLPQRNIKRYIKKNGKWQLVKKVPNRCWKMWHSCEITWDGKVLPCCFDKNANYTMGNIEEKQLQQIWKNSKYQKFRKQIFNNRTSIPMCNNCIEGL